MLPPGAVISGFRDRDGRGPQEEKSLIATEPFSDLETVRVFSWAASIIWPLARLMHTVGIL